MYYYVINWSLGIEAALIVLCIIFLVIVLIWRRMSYIIFIIVIAVCLYLLDDVMTP